MTRKKHVFVRLMCLLVLSATAMPALAGDNDLVLSRFATFDPNEYTGCDNACGQVVPDVPLFEALVTDLGQVFAPRFAAPAETLGQAGFAVNLKASLSDIPHNDEHWKKGVESGNPSSTLFTSHVQVRKGLPFSFEFAGDLGYLFASEMFTLGSNLKWALNEGFYYFPDVAVRGTINTLLGAEDLNLITTGWDVSMSKAFNISGVMALTPYAGYQQLYIIGSSRLLNAYPQDPRPPQVDPDNANRAFSPEFVFAQYTTTVNRLLMGMRLKTWIMSFTLEAVLSDGGINQYTFAGGVDF